MDELDKDRTKEREREERIERRERAKDVGRREKKRHSVQGE